MAPQKARDKEKQKERQREAMKRLRAVRKSDPEQYEEEKRKERERWKKRKEQGKIKQIAEMTERQKRIQRKKWRESSKKKYDQKKSREELVQKLEEDTPPSSPLQFENEEQAILLRPQEDRRVREGRLRRRRTLHKLRTEIANLKEAIKKETKKKLKYKQRLKRIASKKQDKKATPLKKVEEMIGDQKVTPTVKRNLIFGEVMRTQLMENYKKINTNDEKKLFRKHVFGDRISKLKKTTQLTRTTSCYVRRKITSLKRKNKMNMVRKIIQSFFESDETSRVCPGKFDFVKRNKIKKQKRLLNDSMKNLYKVFLSKNPITISYATFCKCRPFWVVYPSVAKRDTCLCILHTNFGLIVQKMKILGMIKEATPQDVCKTLCCPSNKLDEKCLKRYCDKCKSFRIFVNIIESEMDDTVLYNKWVTKKVEVIIKGSPKICTKTMKDKVTITKKQLAQEFFLSLDLFLVHVQNIVHQQKTIQEIKNNLKQDEVLIHLDFSENYNTKYGEEVQSAHFGGSKPQLSLHTVVTYHKDGESNQLVKTCFCTISPVLRHDPVAIVEHLKPVINDIKTKVGTINYIHFLSDGPSTQYRNRKMMWLTAAYLPKLVKFQILRWHFSEKGHGKGAPDGVGGCIKRTADSLVARGNDIPDFESFVSCVCQNIKGIKIYGLKLQNLDEIESCLPQVLPKVKGLMKTHEFIWNTSYPYIEIRELSCLECNYDCNHCKLDTFNIKNLIFDDEHPRERIRYSDVYSNSSSDQEDHNAELKDAGNNNISRPDTNDFIIVVVKGKKKHKKIYSIGRRSS